MEENKTVIEKEKEKSFPFWQILYKNLLLMIAITIICGAIGTAIGVVRAENRYTASSNIILKATYEYDTEGTTNELNNNTLAKRTLPTIISLIKSPRIIDTVKEGYGEFNANNISTKYTEDSLIFTISYTDDTRQKASLCLKNIVEAIQDPEKGLAATDLPGVSKIEFVETSRIVGFEEKKDQTDPDVPIRDYDITVSNKRATYIIVGFLGGAVLAVATAFLIYILYNKVKEGYELEEITGSSVLAVIDK